MNQQRALCAKVVGKWYLLGMSGVCICGKPIYLSQMTFAQFVGHQSIGGIEHDEYNGMVNLEGKPTRITCECGDASARCCWPCDSSTELKPQVMQQRVDEQQPDEYDLFFRQCTSMQLRGR